MVPKISDFGLARICIKNEDEALTTASPGTYGYMSPEYAGEGKYSKKSDVYSFGVIVLEIVSGKKNRTFSLSDPNCANLLSHVWINWMNGSWEKIVDEIILHDSSQSRQILRCIEIGLLCVQKLVQDRPKMSSVVMMLGNETSQIPKSKTPGFYIGKSPDDPSSSTPEPSCSVNQCTVTNISPR
ncbi:G-type lectin S-receptor-like serine/threonine-protein kinase SRK [Arabidopsis lyrata subsp. lyrata]|nr:G-type lectin S-receptor-like serine/threonine-protein kinase SRK [Arabidopsis lyrata subsp. lyrata]|eukprot:XP_002874278.2 G-type lectin S-receptor-like serine/threonine-protein kinase SRK [Arabidopsis lyrata subsp. lyrata]